MTRQTREEWRRLCAGSFDSGLTVRAYAERHGVNAVEPKRKARRSGKIPGLLPMRRLCRNSLTRQRSTTGTATTRPSRTGNSPVWWRAALGSSSWRSYSRFSAPAEPHLVGLLRRRSVSVAE